MQSAEQLSRELPIRMSRLLSWSDYQAFLVLGAVNMDHEKNRGQFEKSKTAKNEENTSSLFWQTGIKKNRAPKKLSLRFKRIAKHKGLKEIRAKISPGT